MTDSELDWAPPQAAGTTYTTLQEYLALPAGSPGLAVAQQYVGNPGGFETALATRYFQVTTAVYAHAATQQACTIAWADLIAPLYEDAPWMVGDEWFEYVDEPQGGRVGDGENSNFGLVNVNDQPYSDLVNEMQLMHSILADRIGASGPRCDSWANGPNGVVCTATLPKVTYPVSIVDVHGHEKVRSYGHRKSALVATRSPQC